MEIDKALILMVTGLVAGFINTVAGGGSLLTLPVFIFLGFDTNVANATNRIAIFFQNTAAIIGFRQKKVGSFPYSIWLGIAALCGAVLGARLAVNISDELFNKILAFIMLGVSVIIIFNPLNKVDTKAERFSVVRLIIALLVFFLIGVYGGFIQAGTGFLVIAALLSINNLSLVKSNSIKVVVVFLYTIVALIVFIVHGLVDWKYGFALAIGQAAGGYLGSHWTVRKGDVWIRRVLIVMIVLMALKLLGLPLLNPN